MDNEPLTPPRASRIIGIVLLSSIVFLTSLWLGHRLGNTSRRGILAALPTNPEQTKHFENELKHAAHNVLQPKNTLPEDSTTSQPALSRQRNILLIGIDSFQAEEPRLEGVWMIFYMRDFPHFMLVPIYPNQFQNMHSSAVVDQNLAHLFRMDEGQIPNSIFLQALKDKELWWDGYIILDRSALSEVVALVSTEDESTRQSQQLSVSNIPDVEEAPERALLGQAELAQELCRNSSWVLASNSNQLSILIARASVHIRTDLNLGEIAGEVKSALRYGGGISCEFPSMATAANLP
jgi:hypothetical protein